MNALYHNNLRFYTLRINESPELAERMAQDFEDKFYSLSKWDQVNMSLIIEMDGWEKAFEEIEKL